jgi:hypothetical protein
MHTAMHCSKSLWQHAGAAATITGAATSAASLGIVSGGSGAAGAAFYSSRMAKRSADVSEFGFVRLSQWDAYKAETQGVRSRSNSIAQQLENQFSAPEESHIHRRASVACDSSGSGLATSPARLMQGQGSLRAFGSNLPATTSSAPVLAERRGSLPSTSLSPGLETAAVQDAGSSIGSSPGSSRRRTWTQWGQQKLWRRSSSFSADGNPGVICWFCAHRCTAHLPVLLKTN